MPASGRFAFAKCAKTAALLPFAWAIFCAAGRWHVAHSSSTSRARDEWSIVSRRMLASTYGTRPAFAIIVPRHEAPIETSSPLEVTRLLWQATHSLDGANIGPSGGLVACVR